MKRNINTLSLIALIAGFLVSTAYPVEYETDIHKPADIMGRGGASVAITGGWNSMFYNPALLGTRDYKAFSILQAGVTANWDLYEFYQIYNTLGPSTDTSALTPAQWQTLVNLKAHVALGGPLALGYVGNGLGIMLYDDFDTSMVFHQSAGLPYVDFATIVDIGFKAGYGFELPFPLFLGKFGRFYGGFTVTYLNRVKYEDPRMSIAEAFDLGMNIGNFSQGLYMGQNISSDLGFLVKLQYINIGVTVKNWLSTGFKWSEYDANFQKITGGASISNSYFKPSLDLGMSFNLGKRAKSLMELTLSADVINALDFSENYFLKLRMGAEMRLLRILVARAGFYKGYPTLGLSLDLPLIKVNAAYYTEELGALPGSLPEQNLTLEIGLVI